MIRVCRGKTLLVVATVIAVHSTLYYLTASETLYPHGRSQREDIDVVYLFVNGSDPAHQAVLRQVLTEHSSVGAKSFNSARWRDWGELRYSVRSLFRHVPWFRYVYFVLSNNSTQVPTWLDKNHPRVRVVTHQQIFPHPEHELPSLSSRSIESSLHRIQNLSARFILMNDDFFVWRALSKRVLFPTAASHYICLEAANAIDEKSARRKELTARQRSVLYVNKLVNDYYGSRERRDDCHAPQVVDVQLMQQLQETFAGEFDKVYANRARSGDTITPRLFYNQWLLQTQPSFRPVTRLWSLVNALSFRITSSKLRNRIYFAMARLLRPQFVAVNDDVEDNANLDELQAQVTEFFEMVFPDPSPVEIVQRF